MNFTTICPACGSVYRLLDKYLNRKVMCDDCGNPFRAQSHHLEEIEVETLAPTPGQGWLLVCPACGHSEVVPEEGHARAHCSRCDTPLAVPVVESKKIRRRRIVKKRTRTPRPQA